MAEKSPQEAELSPLEQAQARRDKLKAEARKAYEAQRVIDLDAITELEISSGDTLGVVNVLHATGLPTCVAVRCPKPVEMKRFRDQVRPHKKTGELPDSIGPAEVLATVCLVYPDRETYAKMCEARPGISVTIGGMAVSLATGRDEAEGKG